MQAYYWIGAIPAMVFVALFMIPFYYASRVHSVPGFLKLRYNEVLQFFLILLDLVPLVIFGLVDIGGLAGLQESIGRADFFHAWSNTGSADSNPMAVHWFAIVFGLGFVQSFGYWCTDFLVVQRALAAEDASHSGLPEAPLQHLLSMLPNLG